MAAPIQELELSAEQKYGLPEGLLSSIRQQETGGRQEYIDDPTKPHYSSGRTDSGVSSSAFGPYGLLESTAKQPGYGTAPLKDKTLVSQVDFAAQYVAGRTKAAGSLEAGLAGYGEGPKYAKQVLNKLGGNTAMATTPDTQTTPTEIDTRAAGNISRTDAAATAVEGFNNQIQQSYGNLISTRNSQSDSVQTVKTVELMSKAKAQANSAEAAVALGTDPNSATYILNQVANEYKTNSERAQKFADHVAYASDPSNIFDDPLKYIGDFVFHGLYAEGQRSAQIAADKSKERFIGLNNMTQEVAQTQAAVAQSVTTETARLAGQVAADDIKIDAIKLNIDALKTNSEGVVRATQLRNDSFSTALRARDQVLQESQLTISRQNSALQAESLQVALDDRKERLALKQEEAASRDNMLNLINTGRAMNGNLPPFKTFDELQTAVKLDPKLKDIVSSQYQAGLTAGQTGVASIGSTPYETIKYVASSGARITDGRSKVITFLDKVKTEILSNPKLSATIKKEADLAQHIDSTALAAAGTMSRNITSGTGNIYAPPPASVFLQDTEFSKTYIAQNIMAGHAEVGADTVNFKATVGKLIEDTRKGKISLKQADSELGFLAEKIKIYNNELYRYSATAGIPDMKTVNVALDDTSSFSNLINESAGRVKGSPIGALTSMLFGGNSEEIVDLSDPNKRADYLNKRMAQNIPPVIREQALINSKSKLGGK